MTDDAARSNAFATSPGAYEWGAGPSVFPLLTAQRADHEPDREPPDPRVEPLPAAARPQPGGLVPVGPGGPGASPRAGPPHLPERWLLGLPLVPRDGARELRGRGNGHDPERALRQHQGRSRGAAGP